MDDKKRNLYLGLIGILAVVAILSLTGVVNLFPA